MQVFEDEFRDCALLAFEKVVVNPTLEVSVRSLLLHRGAYLGPYGHFQARPHYFTLERVVTEHGARFRAGPDMAVHMRSFDRVEVCSNDEWLREEGVWGEAGTPGAAVGLARINETTRALAEAGWGGAPATSQMVNRNEDFDRMFAGAVVHPKPMREHDHAKPKGGAAYGAYQEPPRTHEPDEAIVLQPQTRRTASRGGGVWLSSGFALFALAALGFLATPDIRCTLLGACEIPPLNDDQRLEHAGAAVARNCAMAKSQATEFCAVEECIAPYRRQFPNGGALTTLNHIAAAASDNCNASRRRQQEAREAEAPQQQDAVVLASLAQSEQPSLPLAPESAGTKEAEQLLSAARQCATANPCVAPACYDEVSKQFASGARASELQAEIASAVQHCAASPNTVLPDGVYSGRAMAGCGAPQQFGIPVKVRGGSIAWQHDATLTTGNAPVAVEWNGTIDSDGNIRASARNAAEFQASGRYHDGAREVAMHYQGCVAMLSISGRVK